MTFVKKIKKIIKDAGYTYKIRSWTTKCENGLYEKVTVYAGRNIEKVAQKRSRKLVAWKDEKGVCHEIDLIQNKTCIKCGLVIFKVKTIFSDRVRVK